MIKQNKLHTLLLLTYELKQREEMRIKALNDFTYFLHVILGFDFLNEKEHYNWIEWLSTKRKRKFIMAARGSGKSTLITVSYSLWRLINDNNIRILIVSATEKLSKKFLYQIKYIIENNELFIRIFGNIMPKAVQNKKWDTTEIRVEGKTKYRESNIKCCGITKPPTGDHVDLFIGDDIVNLDDTTSTALREDKKIKFREICSNILSPNGTAILVGTTWHYDDMHQEILAKNKLYIEELQWDMKISLAKVDGKLVFPELVSEKKLQQARIELGYIMYRMQYYLEITPENTLFSIKNLTYYDYEYYENNKKDFIIGIGIDLAEKTKDINDYTAIIVLGYHRKIKNKFYVLDEWVERLTPTKYIDVIIQYYQKWKPNKLVIENNNFGNVLISMLKEKAIKMNINLPLVSFRNTKNKDVRIRRLEPLMHKFNGTIAIPKEIFGQICPKLIDQLIKYDGKSGFDDAPDSLELIYNNMKTINNTNITIETHGSREWNKI